MKTCSRCKEEKEDSAFGMNRGAKDGLSYWCRSCRVENWVKNRDQHAEYSKKHRAENRETINEQARKRYLIHKKSIDERNAEYHASHKKEMSAYLFKYRAEHKEQMSIFQKQYYSINRERAAERMKKYRDGNKDNRKRYTAENREAIIACRKKWRSENKEHIAESRRLWAANNPEKNRQGMHKRNSIKRELAATLTIQQWENTKAYFQNTCSYCGRNNHLQQDHFIALSKLGEYSHNNIIPACKRCNVSKHNNSFFDWYPRQSFYSKRRERKILMFLNYDDGIQQLSLALS